MQDEIYDIFNEAWEKIGTATWTEVHTRGLLHQTSAVMIFRDETRREFLLQRRAHTVSGGGLLTNSAGGHALTGQTPDECMHDELADEIFFQHGLPKDLTMHEVTVFLNEDIPNNREILHVYEIIYPGPFFHNPAEVAEPPQWIVWSDLLRDMRAHPKNYTRILHALVALPYFAVLSPLQN